MTAIFRLALLPVLLFMSSFAIAQDALPPEGATAAGTTTVAGEAAIETPDPVQPPAASTEIDTPVETGVDSVPAPADATEAVTASPEAPAQMQGGPIAAPPEGMGQVVFFREKKFAGAAIRYKVREGDTELGKLSSGTYFVVPVAPGAHEYTVHSEAKDILNLEIEAGETYYVIGSVTMGFFAGHPNLSPSDQSTFEGMFAKLKSAAR